VRMCPNLVQIHQTHASRQAPLQGMRQGNPKPKASTPSPCHRIKCRPNSTNRNNLTRIMGSYSQSLPTSSNSTWTSNEASITPPQNELGDSGTICKLTTALSEAVQTERIDSLRPLLGKWDQAVTQYRKTTENTIRELEERERTFFLTYATSNTAPFPMTQGGAIQDVDDTM
jgi:hypothetical protein